MGKNKKLLLILVAILIGISTTVYAMPEITAIIERMSMSETERELLDELAGMTTDEVVDEMNTILNAGYEPDSAMYHAMTLNGRLDELDADYLLSVSCDDTLHTVLRYTMLQLYSEKMGNDTDVSKLLRIIMDESEDSEVRANAIYALPSDDENICDIVSTLFFSVEDEGVAYHLLKYLWIRDSVCAENVADKVLSDYNNYSDERLCAAMTAKKHELSENNGSRSFDDLMLQKDAFTDICIEIYEKTGVFSAESQNEEYAAWKDPVRISAVCMAELGSEKSARYILNKSGFISENKLDRETMDYICRSAVRANYLALEKLAQTSNKEEDIDLLLTATEYIPYNIIVKELKAKIDSGAVKGKEIKYPYDFDGIFAEVETNHAKITSWEVMR